MTDTPSSDKKRTLTVKPSTKEESSDKPVARKRIGARARNASLIEINREKRKRASQTDVRPDQNHQATSSAEKPTHRKARAVSSRPISAKPDQPAPRESRSTVRSAEIFKAFAPCPVGLEQALAAELTALGFEGVRGTRAGVHFEVDWWGVQRANLYSRLATRILVRVAHGTVLKEDDIYDLARTVQWERWFGAEQSLRVDTSAVKSPFKSLQFCNLRAKDGICDHLRDLEGERPSIDTVRPDARVHLFLGSDTGTLYLDTSGESLFKRGWRLDKGEAPLR